MFTGKRIISSAIACGALAPFTFTCSLASADDARLIVKPAVQRSGVGENSGATIQLARWGRHSSRGGWQGGGPSYGGHDWGGFGPNYGGRYGYGLDRRDGYGAYGVPGNYGYGIAYPAGGYGASSAFPRSGAGVGFW